MLIATLLFVVGVLEGWRYRAQMVVASSMLIALVCLPLWALTATIAAELGETANGSEHYQALFTLGILLFIVTFFINLSADIVVRGIRRK